MKTCRSMPFAGASRSLLSLLACAASFFALRAEPVFIPDVAFRAVLNAEVTGAVDADGYLDPDAPVWSGVNMLELMIDWSPADLTGLNALTGIRGLSISSVAEGAAEISLPALPPLLERLDLSNVSAATLLPAWPSSLNSLYMEYAGGVPIPELPEHLDTLWLDIAPTVTFPALPDAIKYLNTTVPSSGLPAFPSSLITVILTGGDATALPPWPGGVQEIRLQYMQALMTVPALPSSIRRLDLRGLMVDRCPELPEGLIGLHLVNMGQLHCLPLLPASLLSLTMDLLDPEPEPLTDIACLPNFPPNMEFSRGYDNIELEPALLCTTQNSVCPLAGPYVSGSVYWDRNANGTRESDEPGYAAATIRTATGGMQFGVSPDGSYRMALPAGDYTLAVVGDPSVIASVSPASIDVSLSGPSFETGGHDLGVVLNEGIQDLRVDVMPMVARPGFDNTVAIVYTNRGSTTLDGEVAFTFSSDQTWVGSTPASTSLAGNTATWSLPALGPGTTGTITVSLHTDAAVALRTVLFQSAEIGPLAGDATPADNRSDGPQMVVGSFDPNDKTVSPATVVPEEVAGTELTWTVRFQNTGNYLAERVLITDTLSADLRWGTFRMIGSSHPCTWLLQDNGVLRFTFDGIMLPDSNSDALGSQGFVRFTMAPRTDLGDGARVANTANIFFDFNAPVITEPAVFAVDASTRVTERMMPDMQVFPNPVNGLLTIAAPDAVSGAPIVLTDITGREVRRMPAAGPRTSMDLTALAPGTYMVRMVAGGHLLTQAIVKR
ncbi:MAG: T9SS type A sorting domain-containing protein [Flavobacteriales bacterium]